METILRHVIDMACDDRRSLEHVVGAHLRDNQQVLIHVLDIGVVPSEDRAVTAGGDGVGPGALAAETIARPSPASSVARAVKDSPAVPGA